MYNLQTAHLILEAYSVKVAALRGKSTKSMGKIIVPISSLIEEPVNKAKVLSFLNQYSRKEQELQTVQVVISRECIKSPPPIRKTIFLLRHAQSKWNEAEANWNVAGLMDKDHALNEVGVDQIKAFQHEWAQYKSQVQDNKIVSEQKVEKNTSNEQMEKIFDLLDTVPKKNLDKSLR